MTDTVPLTGTLPAAGTHFDYVEVGAGEPIVLVHGSASDRRTWERQVADFAGRHRVFAYSRRYHWPNPAIAPGHDYAMQEQVDDLIAVLDAAHLGPAHLVGHSYGAFLSLLVAIQRPDCVRSLVLTEPPAVTLFVSNQPKPLEMLRLLAMRPRTGLAIAKLGAKGFAPATKAIKAGRDDEAFAIFGAAVLGPRTFASLSPERLEQGRANFIAAELVGSGLAPLRSDDVQGLSVPVLLIQGERSPAVFHRVQDRLAELMPHAQRVQIPGASHAVHEDNPVAFAEAVRSFLVSI